MEVTEKGFQPSSINVKPATDVTLNITRKTNSTCATQIKVPSNKITEDLPLNKEIKVHLGKLNKGEVRFSCGMDMVTGVIIVN